MNLQTLKSNEMLWHKEHVEIVQTSDSENWNVIYKKDRFEFLYQDDLWYDIELKPISWFEPLYDEITKNSYLRIYLEE